MKLRIEGTGPPVVKVAGLAGGVGLYREEVEAALAAGFRVASLDTTGDRADDPSSGPLSWEGLAAEVLEAAARVGAPAVLWGTSYGCLVCLAAAARAPERIAGLLLCSAPEPGSRPAHWIRVLDWCSARPSPDRSTANVFHVGFSALNAWEFVRPAALARLPALGRAAADARTPARTIRQKLELLWRDHPGLPGTPLPVTLIGGAWDTVAPAAGARRLAAALPGSRLRLIPWSGHSVAYARPRRYHAWAIEELRRLTRTPGHESADDVDPSAAGRSLAS